MIKVLYFARFREMLDTAEELLELDAQTGDVSALMQQLAQRGGRWEDIFASEMRVMTAINQEMVQPNAALADGDEVAFFPPVTGG